MGARCTAFLAATLLCVCASCAWIEARLARTPEEPEVSETTLEAELPGAYDPEEPLVERRRRAIDHLGNGREEDARLELTGVLHQSPTDARARDLMLQIDATPEEYFAPAFHGTFSDYELPHGSSLSGVAKECLGDSLKFYALWKLNRDNPSIARPNQVEGATTIRIPGPPCARAPAPVQPSEKAHEPVQPTEQTQADLLEEIDAAIGIPLLRGRADPDREGRDPIRSGAGTSSAAGNEPVGNTPGRLNRETLRDPPHSTSVRVTASARGPRRSTRSSRC